MSNVTSSKWCQSLSHFATSIARGVAYLACKPIRLGLKIAPKQSQESGVWDSEIDGGREAQILNIVPDRNDGAGLGTGYPAPAAKVRPRHLEILGAVVICLRDVESAMHDFDWQWEFGRELDELVGPRGRRVVVDFGDVDTTLCTFFQGKLARIWY